MITGTLIKFEPTDKGITVMIRCADDQMNELVTLFRKEVRVGTSFEVQDSKEVVLKAVQDSLENIRLLLQTI